MHPHFHNELLEEDFPDYEIQLDYMIKSIKKYQIETYFLKNKSHFEYISLLDKRHANYFVNLMFKYGEALNLKVTYELLLQDCKIYFWFERQ